MDRVVQFTELCNIGVRVLDCEHRTPPDAGDGYPYIAIPNLVDGRLDLRGVRRMTQALWLDWTRRTRPQPGDIIVTRRGRVGDAAVVPAGLDCAIGQNLVILRSDESAVSQAFLRWATRGPMWDAEVHRLLNVGAVFDSLNVRDIARIRIPIPSAHDQAAIGEVLGALDDKIEANQVLQFSINELIPAAVEGAQARSATELRPLSELVEPIRQLVQPKQLAPRTAYVGLEHLPRGSLFLTGWASADGLVSAKARFQTGDVLFGKLRPYFKKVSVAPVSGVCSTDILVLRPRQQAQSGLVLAACASDALIDYASAGSQGTRMPRVSWDYLSRWRVAVPHEDAVTTLQERLGPMIERAVHATRESMLLARLRDTLLPRLLSGEVRLRDAEKLVEASV